MTSKGTPAESKAARSSHLRWVPISEMRVSPSAQREFRPAHAESMAADFDLEALGFPVLNRRDGHWYIVDAQHRIAALKLIGWSDQQVQCECYEGLSEADEAELYLRRNKRKNAPKIEEFRIAITAGREKECDIDRIVRSQGLRISKDGGPGAIRAVAALDRIYTKAGPAVLSRTLQIVRDGYGDAGFEGLVIEGVGLLCQRYNGEMPDEKTVADRLGAAHGSVNGLLSKAETLRRQTGNAKTHCVAAAAVEILNTGRVGKKIPSWWKS